VRESRDLRARVASPAWLLAALLGACAPEPAVSIEAIARGTPDVDHVAVGRLDNGFARCTAVLVATRVALTARHCVVDAAGTTVLPAASFRLYLGPSDTAWTSEHSVAAVEIIPGSTSALDDGLAEDLALVVLSAPAPVVPHRIDLSPPSRLVGTDGVAVGYGIDETGVGGIRRTVPVRVDGYIRSLLRVGPGLCTGDSGGPLLDGDGVVRGVASFTFPPMPGGSTACGDVLGAYNELARHEAWIRSVLESVPGSCTPADEACDGDDDDCDGRMDEGCLAIGEPCTPADACTGECAATRAGTICTRTCDAARPLSGCPSGFWCAAHDACAGYCVPGAPGVLALGAGCATDEECASLHCASGACAPSCRPGEGLCFAGEVCGASACGTCVPPETAPGPRELGEPCAAPADCASGACRSSECTRPCGAGCPAGWSCEADACVRAGCGTITDRCAAGAECRRTGETTGACMPRPRPGGCAASAPRSRPLAAWLALLAAWWGQDLRRKRRRSHANGRQPRDLSRP
jgi:hypothetical protein